MSRSSGRHPTPMCTGEVNDMQKKRSKLNSSPWLTTRYNPQPKNRYESQLPPEMLFRLR
ncbi:hypothetical protein GCM10009596_32140 [Arthrobacter rhombi]